MASPHAYFALSFVFSALFFSQPNAGVRVSSLMCRQEGVASVWFDCDLFFVCEREGVSPLLERCAWLQTFDLDTMRCHRVVAEVHSDFIGKEARPLPCKPWPGTDEKYWFQILKVIGPGNVPQHGRKVPY